MQQCLRSKNVEAKILWRHYAFLKILIIPQKMASYLSKQKTACWDLENNKYLDMSLWIK